MTILGSQSLTHARTPQMDAESGQEAQVGLAQAGEGRQGIALACEQGP